MKAIAKNLVLFAGGAGLHAGLRHLFYWELGRYAAQHPCGCGRTPAGEISLIKITDFFIYTFSFGNLIIGDLLSGVVVLSMCLLIKKWRMLSDNIGRKRNGLVAAWIIGDLFFYLGLILGPVALVTIPGRWLYDWVYDALLIWPVYVGGLCVTVAVSKALFSGGGLLRSYTRHRVAVLKV